MLQVQNIEKYYGSQNQVTKALDRVSFTVEDGAFIAIMGASGSGKTTLLNCISTIDTISAGDILLDGQSIAQLSPRQLAQFRRERLGFVFQDCNLLDTLTLEENIGLALSLNHADPHSVQQRVRAIAEELEIGEILDKFPYQVSGGQKQRAACARAMVAGQSLLLADEPTGALDSKASKNLLEIMTRLNRVLGATILMVTHDPYSASYASRVLFLKDYANYIQDEIVTNLTDLDRNMMLSIDILNVPTDEAVREVENRLLGVETNITNWQRRQNQNNNFSAIVPYDMELQRRESKEFLADLTTRDQRMMQAVLTLVITADTKQQLDTDTEKIRSLSGRCQLAVLKYQQIDGLNTVLPIGTRKINAFRTLTTESLAVFMPFKVQEIMDRGGIYFGENAISHNLIMCNKANLLNQSSFRLGVPGSGKSFSVKEEIVFLILNTDDDILIADPEGEYAPLIEAMDGVGSVIRVAAGGKDRLNAMYMVDGYGENNPIVVKSQFIMSLVERIDPKGVGPQHNSIIDRCTGDLYEEAEQNDTVPTLAALREKLMEQPEAEAREIALALELFTTGSLDIFGHDSTVDLDKRVVVFDIHGLGEQLKPIGHLVITDTMLNRVTLNWKKGRRTHVFIDEFHVMFENEFSAAFFNSAWRQFRKRNAYPTAITQNVEYLLDSVQASTMLSNSEFIVMLNQAAGDREKLAHLLNISEEQMSYITNADAGCGLIKYGSALVPFANRFPHNTELYRLMTTRPGEGRFSGGRA